MKMDTDRLFEEMKLYKRFIDGITVSGGECTLQQEFLVELFTRAKAEGLTCMIDTNGSNDFKKIPELVALCDGFMLDVKVYDAKLMKNIWCA
ncbi:MAG: radical SAM protein [Zhenhengia sp.]